MAHGAKSLDFLLTFGYRALHSSEGVLGSLHPGLRGQDSGSSQHRPIRDDHPSRDVDLEGRLRSHPGGFITLAATLAAIPTILYRLRNHLVWELTSS